ncbi:MAG: hypothetical protein GY920_20360 [Aliivibrio sp.]|nr:hypothetical protein [Aliivibrio sp.]MCP4322182.1 hypothetical protein [Alteromonadales bacterium]
MSNIKSLNDLRKVEDLRISVLASYLADCIEKIDELEGRLKDERKATKARIEELETLIIRLEEIIEGD